MLHIKPYNISFPLEKKREAFTKIPDLFPGSSAPLPVVQFLVVALLVAALTLNTVVMAQLHTDLKTLEVQSQVLAQ